MRCRVSVKVGTSLTVLHRSSSYNWRALPDDVQNLRSIGPGRNKSVRSGQEELYLPKRFLLPSPSLSRPFCCSAVLASIRAHYSHLGRASYLSSPLSMGYQLLASLTTLSCTLLFVRLLHLVKHNRMLCIHVNNFPLTKDPIVRKRPSLKTPRSIHLASLHADHRGSSCQDGLNKVFLAARAGVSSIRRLPSLRTGTLQKDRKKTTQAGF